MTIRGLLLALPLLFVGWLGVLITVGLFTDDAPASVVLFPSENFARNLPDDTSILAANAYSMTVSSSASGFAASLYKSGALIVLPAGLPGCLPLPKT